MNKEFGIEKFTVNTISFIEILINEKHFDFLDPCMHTGSVFSSYSFIEYHIQDLQPTMKCHKRFEPIYNESELNLKFYRYKILYQKINGITDYKEKKYHFIIEINDKVKVNFYLYVSNSFTSDCSTCSISTHHKKDMIYSDDLQDLIDFVFTVSQQEFIIFNQLHYL